MTKEIQNPVIVWFRQDLRLQDNDALNAAIETGKPIIPLYIKEDESRIHWKMGSSGCFWLHYSLLDLESQFKKLNLKLIIRQGNPMEVLLKLIKETSADALFWNRCYEPASIKRDAEIKATLKSQNMNIQSFNASLLFEPWEISNKQGKPFKVFTPFWNTCLKFEIKKPISLSKKQLEPYSHPIHSDSIESLRLLSRKLEKFWNPGALHVEKMLNDFLEDGITHYEEMRDRPDLNGVSHLSPYLHFGNISSRMIWDVVKTKFNQSNAGVTCFLKQLGWREFGYHLLYHFPKTESQPLHQQYMDFPWKNDEIKLKAWQEGMTGYPLVDAGMRELKATGWMHNRVRMVVGSFLVKDLLIAWQLGSKWFYEELVDADLANNTLGWQWVSGCGADAAPYFRIFNPTTQAEKFDPDGVYIKKWVPELSNLGTKWIHKPFLAPSDVLKSADIELGDTYPKPIVDHAKARILALEALKQIKGQLE